MVIVTRATQLHQKKTIVDSHGFFWVSFIVLIGLSDGSSLVLRDSVESRFKPIWPVKLVGSFSLQCDTYRNLTIWQQTSHGWKQESPVGGSPEEQNGPSSQSNMHAIRFSWWCVSADKRMSLAIDFKIIWIHPAELLWLNLLKKITWLYE